MSGCVCAVLHQFSAALGDSWLCLLDFSRTGWQPSKCTEQWTTARVRAYHEKNRFKNPQTNLWTNKRSHCVYQMCRAYIVFMCCFLFLLLFPPLIGWVSSEGFGAFKTQWVVPPSWTRSLLIHTRVECCRVLTVQIHWNTSRPAACPHTFLRSPVPSPGLRDPSPCCRASPPSSYPSMTDACVWSQAIFIKAVSLPA